MNRFDQSDSEFRARLLGRDLPEPEPIWMFIGIDVWDRVLTHDGHRHGTVVALVDFGDETGARIRWDEPHGPHTVRIGELRPDMFQVVHRYREGMSVRSKRRSIDVDGVVRSIDQSKGILVAYGTGSGAWEHPWDLVPQ